MSTPAELASYTKCQPDRISHWIGQRIVYRRTERWESAETCMARGSGDCKCMAVVARDTINSCAGMEAWITILRNGAGGLHAVVFLRDHTGSKWFIDSISRKEFPSGTDWNEVAGDIRGGPWAVEEQRYAAGTSGGGQPSAGAFPATPAYRRTNAAVVPGNAAEYIPGRGPGRRRTHAGAGGRERGLFELIPVAQHADDVRPYLQA